MLGLGLGLGLGLQPVLAQVRARTTARVTCTTMTSFPQVTLRINRFCGPTLHFVLVSRARRIYYIRRRALKGKILLVYLENFHGAVYCVEHWGELFLWLHPTYCTTVRSRGLKYHHPSSYFPEVCSNYRG